MTSTKLDEFAKAYIQTALWSSIEDDDIPLDENYSEDDLAPECLAKMVADCARFQSENADDLNPDNCLKYGPDFGPMGRAGHDFWLTRNGHGAGFWDGDWVDIVGERLTKASKTFGECDLYVGDDGKIYC